jgi:hypothetical protein
MVVRTIGRFGSPLRFLGNGLRSGVTAVDDGGVVRVIVQSAIGKVAARLGAGLAQRIDQDWRRSRVATAASELASRFVSIPVWQRIRLTALMLCTAVIVHVMLTGFSAPEPTATARLVWIGIGGGLVAAIAGARHLAAAWVVWSHRGGPVHESERA